MRADKFFAEKFSSRTKAMQVLKEGRILRNGKRLSPKDEVKEGDEFVFLERGRTFVSQGGYKLERAIETFQAEIQGRSFADLGASTGGFCDCLLQMGAGHVFCVDVGDSQLAPSLKADSRVTVMDGVNARYLTESDFPVPLDGVTADLSFISAKLVLPAVSSILPEGKCVFWLLKPQFECGKSGLNKQGICPLRLHRGILSKFYDDAMELNLAPQNIVNAPIRERKNIEYMILLNKGGKPLEKAAFLNRAANLFENIEG